MSVHAGDDPTPRAGEGGPRRTATQLASDPAFTGTYAQATDPLKRWKQKLGGSPSSAVVAFVGDSMSDETTSSKAMYLRLRTEHAYAGGVLDGMTGDVFTDGVTSNGSATITSATANFTSADVGKVVWGPTGIPNGATILSRESATSATLSAPATGASVYFTIGRQFQNFGYNGMTLSAWLADSTRLAALVAANPALVIACWGTNDVRLGACDQATLKARLVTFVNTVRTALPTADIVLRIPNPYLTTDVSNLHYIQGAPGDGSNVNPAGAAQSYSNLVRQAYLSLVGYWPSGVLVADVPANVFGTVSLASHPLMADQLHPTASGSTLGANPSTSGYTAIADYLATLIGNPTSGLGPAVNDRAYSYKRRLLVSGGGNGFIDVQADPSEPGQRASGQFFVTTSDTLFIHGYAGPISLAAATIVRPQGSNIRILLSGYDFSSVNGRTAVIAGNHQPETTGDRQIVAVDLPSIAAGATGTKTVTVTGAKVSDNHDATAVVATPPAGFVSAGLLLIGCYPTADNTVTLVVNNPTGGAVDRGSEGWAFWVIR